MIEKVNKGQRLIFSFFNISQNTLGHIGERKKTHITENNCTSKNLIRTIPVTEKY